MPWKDKPASGIPAGGVGKGVGHGGPASGVEAVPFSAEVQPSGDAKSAGKAGRAAMRAFFEEKRLEYARRLDTIALTDADTGRSLAAINSILDRIDGKPVQAVVTQTDPFGGWSAEQLEAAAEWLEQSGTGGGVETAGKTSEGGE